MLKQTSTTSSTSQDSRRKSEPEDVAMLSGVSELISVSVHERRVVSKLWNQVLSAQHGFGQACVRRLLNARPDVKSCFCSEATKQSSNTCCQFFSTFDALLSSENLPNDVIINKCEAIGVHHATMRLKTATSAIAEETWGLFEEAMAIEVRAILMKEPPSSADSNLVAWKHFSGAVIGIIKDAYYESMTAKDSDEED